MPSSECRDNWEALMERLGEFALAVVPDDGSIVHTPFERMILLVNLYLNKDRGLKIALELLGLPVPNFEIITVKSFERLECEFDRGVGNKYWTQLASTLQEAMGSDMDPDHEDIECWAPQTDCDEYDNVMCVNHEESEDESESEDEDTEESEEESDDSEDSEEEESETESQEEESGEKTENQLREQIEGYGKFLLDMEFWLREKEEWDLLHEIHEYGEDDKESLSTVLDKLRKQAEKVTQRILISNRQLFTDGEFRV